nr:NUDIX hydrolase [Corynebacterium lactis]
MHEEDKDREGDTFVTGRLQEIPNSPAEGIAKPTYAAGAVLWRGEPSDPEVCVIHRPHYDDWSLPKGKLDSGENLPATAVREIWEETGYRVRLGKLVGRVSYPVGSRTKLVWYWTAEVLDGDFEKNSEVNELRWVRFDEAEKLVSYDLDRQVLAKARKRLTSEPDARLILVRHGRAHSRANWSGNDLLRPLDKKGRRQAELLVSELEGFHPERIYSADPVRCADTVAPLAAELGLEVAVDERFGDEYWISQEVLAKKAFADVVALGGVSVVCSQGHTIPHLLASLSAAGTLPLDGEINCKKGSAWVLGFNDGVLTTADYYASALPVK